MSMAIKRPSFNKFKHFKQSGFFLKHSQRESSHLYRSFQRVCKIVIFLFFSSVQIIKVDGHEQSSAYFLIHRFLKTEKIL